MIIIGRGSRAQTPETPSSVALPTNSANVFGKAAVWPPRCRKLSAILCSGRVHAAGSSPSAVAQPAQSCDTVLEDEFLERTRIHARNNATAYSSWRIHSVELEPLASVPSAPRSRSGRLTSDSSNQEGNGMKR